jgi:uncharacterized membrane protein
MPKANRRLELQHWVHWTLLLGVAVSGTLLLLGMAIALFAHQPRPEGPPPELGSLLGAALTGSGMAVIDIGLLLLMATPLLRVAVLVGGWALAGDRRFATVALTVLALLALSVVLGVR